MSSTKKRTPSATYARKPTRRPLTSESESSMVSDIHDRSSLKKSTSSQQKSDKKDKEVVAVDDDDDDDGDDGIVEEKTKKKKSKSDDKEDDDDEEDEDEEVFEVSKIKGHRIKKGIYEYEVGWKSYTSEDDTWEPESVFDGAREMLKEYKELHGIGKPKASTRYSNASVKSITSGKKSRSREEDDSDENRSETTESKQQRTSTTGSSKKRQKVEEKKSTSIARLNKNGFASGSKNNTKDTNGKEKAQKNKKTREVSVSSDEESMDSSEWHAKRRNEPSWEHLIKGIRTIERVTEYENKSDKGKGKGKSTANDDDEGDEELNVCLLWHEEGKTTWVPNSVAREKLPQKMLDFYESHLHFTPGAQ